MNTLICCIAKNENKYITTVLKQRVFKGDINNEIKIVYTALNGVGAPFAKRIFKQMHRVIVFE